jgi:hypothetical protein
MPNREHFRGTYLMVTKFGAAFGGVESKTVSIYAVTK